MKALQYVKVFSHESVFSSNFGVSSIIHLPLKKCFAQRKDLKALQYVKFFGHESVFLYNFGVSSLVLKLINNSLRKYKGN